MRSRTRALLSMIGLVAASACGYYNTLYNAKRLFSDAEKASARGDLQAAQTAYQQSIEKAQANLTRHPKSRWSDDARLLLARARLQLGDYGSARSELQALLALNADVESTAAAHIYLAQISAQLGDDADAIAHLEPALRDGHASDELAAIARLTRAGIHYRTGRYTEASSDLRAILDHAPGHMRAQASLLDLRVALAQRDSVRARNAWQALLRNSQSQQMLDSLRSLGTATAGVFSANSTSLMLTEASSVPWRSSARDSLLLFRAELAMLGGDTTRALAEAERVAARASGRQGDAIRVVLAQWKLARVSTIEQLTEIRAGLLPALADDRARLLVQSLKTLEVLMEHARATGQPLAIFAAAELARDELGAPALAGRLFLAYAEIAPQTPWAPKALLAAIAVQPASEPEIRKLLEPYHENPYVAALRGESIDAAFTSAEERLSAALQPLLADATVAALRRDNSVGRAVAVIDSLRVAARTDSTRTACGIMLDSLAVRGIRADSIRAACLRGERTRIAMLQKIDTLLLRDSTKARADSVNRTVRRDTMPHS